MLSEKPWTVERVAMLLPVIATGYCLVGLLLALTAHFSGKGELDDNSVAIVILEYLALDGSILFATAFVLWWNRLTWREAFGFSQRTVWRCLGWGVLTATVFLPVGWLLNWLSSQLLHLLKCETPLQQAVQMLEKTRNPASLAVQVLFAVVVAPVAEEVLFRGALYPSIKRVGFPRLALWSTSLVFAAIHGNLSAFVPLVVLAVVLALLYEYTDNLLAPITAHATFNAVNLLALLGWLPHWFS